MKPFPWRAGMRTTRRDQPDLIEFTEVHNGVDRVWSRHYGWTKVQDVAPDLTDAGTIGAMEAVVCERYGPLAHLIPFLTSDETGLVRWWALADERGKLIEVTSTEGRLRYLAGPTKGAALLAAWKAAP